MFRLELFAMTMSLEKKSQWREQALHPSTNPEILVKIGPLGSEPPVLRRRPLKK